MSNDVQIGITISDREILALDQRLKTIGKRVEAQRKEVLTKAAGVVRDAIKLGVPESAAPVKRYAYHGKNAKKSAKGEGTVVATYFPGNLKRAIKILIHLKDSQAVFVGPKVPRSKRGTKGTFATNARVDGWYAGFMEFGTAHNKGFHYMRNGLESSKAAAMNVIREGFRKVISDFVKGMR